MRTVREFTTIFPKWKGGTKASGVPVCWMITAGHLEETFCGQNIVESNLLLLFR
jgi:hypothetical protein